MLNIYTIPISLYCAKLRILLRHKQLEWQEILPPGGYGSGEYKSIVASGNLPAMVDEGLMLADSEAIAEYLNEKYPDPPMLPAELLKRARVRELSRFHDTRLEPELRKLFQYISPDHRDPVVAKQQSYEITERLTQFATMISDADFRPEDTLSLADCGFPISFAWIDALTPILDLDVECFESVITYRRRIEHHPAVAAELTEYRPRLAQYLQSRVTS
jgi:glutathione S-transferase